MIEIYGTTNCYYCKEAVQLAKYYGLQYEYKNIDYIAFKEELLRRVHEVREAPVIFWDHEYIGNYAHFSEELSSRLDEYGNWKNNQKSS